MNKVFVISDTHFFHENILKFEPKRKALWNTVHEMNEGIIEIWNSVVSEDDMVIHLGDFSFKYGLEKENIKNICQRLNGNKTLLLGNHDREKHKKDPEYFFNLGFVQVILESFIPFKVMDGNKRIICSHE